MKRIFAGFIFFCFLIVLASPILIKVLMATARTGLEIARRGQLTLIVHDNQQPVEGVTVFYKDLLVTGQQGTGSDGKVTFTFEGLAPSRNVLFTIQSSTRNLEIRRNIEVKAEEQVFHLDLSQTELEIVEGNPTDPPLQIAQVIPDDEVEAAGATEEVAAPAIMAEATSEQPQKSADPICAADFEVDNFSYDPARFNLAEDQVDIGVGDGRFLIETTFDASQDRVEIEFPCQPTADFDLSLNAVLLDEYREGEVVYLIDFRHQPDGSTYQARFNLDGTVELYYMSGDGENNQLLGAENSSRINDTIGVDTDLSVVAWGDTISLRVAGNEILNVTDDKIPAAGRLKIGVSGSAGKIAKIGYDNLAMYTLALR